MRGKDTDTGEFSNSLGSPIPRKPSHHFLGSPRPTKGEVVGTFCKAVMPGIQSSVEQDHYTEGLKRYRDISSWHKAL